MINYHILNNSLVVDCNDELYTIQKDDARYDKVIQCIKNDTLELIPDIVDISVSFKKAGLDLVDGIVSINGEALPAELSDRIVAFKDNDLPFDPLLNFWTKLKTNPSFNSRRMLYKFLEHNGHPLTKDGNFIAYRGVTSNFKDYHSGTFDNSVGAVCEVPRDSVDDNPNNTCSFGLHVACHGYAEGFGTKLIKVEVNPEDVVCVPSDYNGTKMRVSKFKVLSECENIDTSHVYESDVDEEERTCSDYCNDYDCKGECNDKCDVCEDELRDDELDSGRCYGCS